MIRIAIAAVTLATLSACATQPEPCTPEWVQWKSEKVLKSFAFQHRGFIRDLRKIEGQLDSAGPLAAMRLIGLADNVVDVFEDFQDDVIPELQSAYTQCGSAEKLLPTFTKFLRQEGVSEEALKWIEGLGALVETFQNREG